MMKAWPLALATLALACTPSSPAPSSGGEPTPAPQAEAEPTAPSTPAPAPAPTPGPEPEAEAAPAHEAPPAAEPDSEEPDATDPDGPEPKDQIEVELADAGSLEIQLRDFELWVSDGSRRAPLRARATELHSVRPKTDAAGEPVLAVEYSDEMACEGGRHRETLRVRNLRARLANAGGMKSYRAGDHEAAAAAFTEATGLDPELDVAWSNLACAEALRGRSAEAVAALRPLLERRPLPTLHTLMTDPDLASIRDAPAFASRWSDEPGTVELRGMTIAYSPHLGMVALRRHEDSWGSCSFTEDLRLHDAATGDLVVTLPLIDWAQTDPSCDSDEPTVLRRHRAEVDAHLDDTQALLRRLGFSVSPDTEQVRVEDAKSETARFRARLPQHGLGLAMGDRRVRVLRGSRVLATSRPLDVLSYTHAGYDPQAGVVFVQWHRSTAEGCADDTEATGFELIVVPPAEGP